MRHGSVEKLVGVARYVPHVGHWPYGGVYDTTDTQDMCGMQGMSVRYRQHAACRIGGHVGKERNGRVNDTSDVQGMGGTRMCWAWRGVCRVLGASGAGV